MGPPGHSPSAFFIILYEFCLSVSQRSPVTCAVSSGKPAVLVLIVGNMMSFGLVVCCNPSRCACSCAMMTAVSRALRAAAERVRDAAVQVLAQERRHARDLVVGLAPGAAARRHDLGVVLAARRLRQREDDVEVGVPLVQVRLDLTLAFQQRRRERALELRHLAGARVVVRRVVLGPVGVAQIEHLRLAAIVAAGQRALHGRRVVARDRGPGSPDRREATPPSCRVGSPPISPPALPDPGSSQASPAQPSDG